LVPYRNQKWVSRPFGFTVPPSVAAVEVIAEAEPVVTVGADVTLTVKYTMGAVLLDPAELEADTVHMYVVPLDSFPEGIGAEFVVTLAEYTMPPLVLSTATE